MRLAAWGHGSTRGTRNGDVHSACATRRNPHGNSLRHAGEAPGKVSVVENRDGAIESSTVLGTFRRASSRDSGSVPPDAGIGFVAIFTPSGRETKRGDTPRIQIAFAAEPLAISETHVVGSRGQSRTFDAVAELHGRAAFVVLA